MQTIFLALTGLLILMLGGGLLTTLTPLVAEHSAWSTYTIGLVAIANICGLIGGSLHAKYFITRLGLKQTFVVFALIITVTTFLQSAVITPANWMLTRFINGYCLAGIYIIIESWLLILSENNSRNKILGIYLLTFYAATAGGSFLLRLINPWTPSGFYLICCLSMLAIIPIIFCKPVSINLDRHSYLNLQTLFKFSPLGMFGCFIAGAILSIFYSFGPIYGQQLNLSVKEIANFMGFTILGGMMGQLPVGKMADKYNRSTVLLVISMLTFMTSLLLLPSLAPVNPLILYTMTFCFGFCSFTLYPVCMGYTIELIPSNQYIAAVGSIIFIYSIGSACGPVISMLILKLTGNQGIFNSSALMSFSLSLFAVWYLKRGNNKKVSR